LATHGVSLGRVVTETWSDSAYNGTRMVTVNHVKCSVDIRWTNTRVIVRMTLPGLLPVPVMVPAFGTGTLTKVLYTARALPMNDAALQSGFLAECYVQ
jgi:hypothetical protein